LGAMSSVVLIVVDALRADHLGCYGGRESRTLAMDAFAHRGVVFRNAIAQAPWTRPSVASLFTGLYPSQHGLVDRVRNVRKGRVNVSALDPAIPTLAELLAGSGVVTAAFLGGNANLKPVFGLTRGFSHVDWEATTDGSLVCETLERYLTGNDEEAAGRESFLYLHLMDVHHCLPEAIPSRLDRGVDLALVAENQSDLRGYYAEGVQRVDGHVGRILDLLERRGILDDAMVVLTADHGEELAEHGAMLAHGRTLYRELVRVPLVVRLPRDAHGGDVIDLPVQLIDLFPTILEHCSVPPVATPGASLLPLIAGRTRPAGPYGFSELLRRDRYAQSVVTPDHHFIVSFQLEEVPDASPADLEPGAGVKIEGLPVGSGSFAATKVSLKPDGASKIRGPVQAVDPDAGTLTVMGLEMQVGVGTHLTGLEREPIAPSDLRVGQTVSATFVTDPDGTRIAIDINRRKPGGKCKIEGTIQGVRDLGEGLRGITVFGIEIPVDGVGVSASWRDKDSYRSKADGLARVMAGEWGERRTELYDHRADPGEVENLADEHPGVVMELETALAMWTASLASASRPAAAVDVDTETLGQLRRMGYVD